MLRGRRRPPTVPRPAPALIRAPAAPALAAAAAAGSPMPSQLLPSHRKAVIDTQSNVIKNLKEYRNRNETTMSWWEENYPDYYKKVVFDLSPEMKADGARHYYKAKRDMRYDLLDPQYTQAFLSSGLKWKDEAKGTTYGLSHITKFHSAIVRGAEYSGGLQLTPEYRNEMDSYLDCMRREKATAKQNNQIEEKDADAIGISLYENICEWAIEDGTSRGIVLWACSVAQWNCMGRPINIDSLGFHNIRKSPGGGDSVVLFYDKNKKNQDGKKYSPKNVYANPDRPFISFFLAMGCYLCINQDRYDRRSDKIFRKQGGDGSASDTYQKGLKDLLKNEERRKKIYDSIRVGHFAAYGYRKGSASHVTTATLDPPPIPSVMLRGEWSLGGSLDVYWLFAAVGDTYVGRCLAGFDPDGEDIATLPPHFKVGSDSNNEAINEAMQLTFGSILEKYPEMSGPLLLFLASIVYHESFLRTYIVKNSKHPFNSIAILHDADLLQKLKDLVTLEPGGEVTQVTGVPRYNKLLKILREVIFGNEAVIKQLIAKIDTIPSVICSAMNAEAAKAGNVTPSMMMGHLEILRDELKTVVTDQLTTAFEEFKQQLPAPAPAVANVTAPSLNLNRGDAATVYGDYGYVDEDAKGKKVRGKQQVFAVPKDFQFPSPCLKNAWITWFRGLPDNMSAKSNGSGYYRAPVRPFRFIEPKYLPQKKRNHFNDCWRPIMEYMQHAAESDASIPSLSTKPTAELINNAYNVAKSALQHEHPDLFSQGDGAHGTWVVATWSKKLRSSKKRKRQESM